MPCDLLVGPLAWLVQGLLFFTGVATVIFQWNKEEKPRPTRTFLQDSLSVGLGCVLAHFMNLLILENLVQDDRCAWYMFYYFLDFCVVAPLNLFFFRCLPIWFLSMFFAKVVFLVLFYQALPYLLPFQKMIHVALIHYPAIELFLAGFFLPSVLNTAQLAISGREMHKKYINKNKT